MRSFGGLLILIGALGFFYCSAHISEVGPIPQDKTDLEALTYPAGKLEMGRYASAFVAAVGVLMALYPRSR
jgi:hypothetical protein